jgi:hypothetical protein
MIAICAATVHAFVVLSTLKHSRCKLFAVWRPVAVVQAMVSGAGDMRSDKMPADIAAVCWCAAADPWTDLYRIEPAKVPPFISPDLAQRILRAGEC